MDKLKTNLRRERQKQERMLKMILILEGFKEPNTIEQVSIDTGFSKNYIKSITWDIIVTGKPSVKIGRAHV